VLFASRLGTTWGFIPGFCFQFLFSVRLFAFFLEARRSRDIAGNPIVSFSDLCKLSFIFHVSSDEIFHTGKETK